jgi:hypothetical protein
LQRTLQQVPFQNRDKLLQGGKESRPKYDTFLKVNYTPDLDTKSLRKIIKPTGKERGKVPTACLSLTKTENLKKKLVRAKLKQYPNPPTSTVPITIQITKQTQSPVEPHTANAV